MYPNPANVLPFPPRPKACKPGERDTMRLWAVDWIESRGSALKTSVGDRRVWFDRHAKQLDWTSRPPPVSDGSMWSRPSLMTTAR